MDKMYIKDNNNYNETHKQNFINTTLRVYYIIILYKWDR